MELQDLDMVINPEKIGLHAHRSRCDVNVQMLQNATIRNNRSLKWVSELRFLRIFIY